MRETLKKTKLKGKEGITLIALVITIIVLLILAGVAISMLSGENGILTRASEAKEQTEVAQKEEETNLVSMDLETYFIISGLEYKCAYGYVTGIKFETKVEQMNKDLEKGGYELKAIDGTDNFTAKESDEEDAEYIVTTGMTITKDGTEVARTVIFGNINCDGKISIKDLNAMSKKSYDEYEEFAIMAMDINHDGYIGNMDKEIVVEVLGGISSAVLEKMNSYQNSTVTNGLRAVRKTEIETIEEYVGNLELSDDSYEWYVNGAYKMRLKGVTSGTTGEQLIDNIGLTNKAYIYREDDDGNTEKITTQEVQEGDEIRLIEPYCAYGNKITSIGTIMIK